MKQVSKVICWFALNLVLIFAIIPKTLGRSLDIQSNSTDSVDNSTDVSNLPSRTLLDSIFSGNFSKDGINTENSGLGGLGSSNFDLGQIEKILDNVITVDEVGTWPGWIHAVIIMTIYWTAHLTVFGIIWLIWWYYLFGEQQMEDQKFPFNINKTGKKNKNPKPYGSNANYADSDSDSDSFLSWFLKTYTNSDTRKRRSIISTRDEMEDKLDLDAQASRVLESIENYPFKLIDKQLYKLFE